MNNEKIVPVHYIISAIKERYGNNDRGCHVRGNWFSPAEVISLIERVADEEGYTFESLRSAFKD